MTMFSRQALLVVAVCSCSLMEATNAFQPPMSRTHKAESAFTPAITRLTQQRRSRTLQPLYFWGNKNKDSSDEESPSITNTNGKEEEATDGNEKSSSGLGGFLPFFARQNKEKETTTQEPEEHNDSASVATAVAVETKEDTEPTPKPSRKPVVQEEILDPVEKAKALRAQAERARLEAEKMDAELTLQKISRLEREMATAKHKDDTDSVERLQREMDALQAKLLGETPKPVMPPKQDKPATTTSTTTKLDSSTPTMITSMKKDVIFSFNSSDFEGLVEVVDKSPNFLKKLFAQMAEIDFVDASDINNTEVAARLLQMQNMDFSYSKRPKPAFTQQEIDYAIQERLFDETVGSAVDNKIVESVKGNETAKALLALEYGYYLDQYDMSKMEQLLDGEDFLRDIVEAINKTELSSTIEVFYPKCTRKEDAPMPTMQQVKMLMADVLPKASFTPRGQPEQVLGGYVVRGTSKLENGDDFIAAIDKQMDKSMLKDKMTVLYAPDFTLIADLEENDLPDLSEEDAILYITGPDIVPDRKRIPLAVTTAFGLATSWYLSVYPFLLNTAILKRTEEQLDLADASMAYDLSWLTELSLPLFITFIGIQLAHEAGHKLVGAANGVSTTFPTFVPSLITGVTSAVTQFKEPPKNKEAMFDTAIAGPLAGMVASLAALVVGSQLTLISDPSLLPALPLDILRQSTLGGGIIDAILGGGALNVPAGSAASQAVSGMTVSLHPVAIAGYIGLILNGLALLPIGTTDGGRIALALFGRGVKVFVGNIFLFTVFLVGILGSDLFLFYFSFLIAFQTGNEIPARNEVDNVSFSRVLLATGSTVLALLTLIPFQQ